MEKLSELLVEKNIIYKKSVINWQEAVDIASNPLLENNSVTKSYIKSMKESVMTYGPYMVLMDNFALMHSTPENGVIKTSMSLLILENSVDMEGREVKIFLVLGAKDKNSHIESLSQIGNILEDEKNFNLFLNGNKKDILRLINK